MRFVYSIRLQPEGRSGFTVLFPDFPEGVTCGQDRKDALLQAADCLEELVAARMVHNEDIPSGGKRRGSQAMVPLPARMAAKSALYLAMRSERLSGAALARRLGVDEREVRRMLDPKHPTKLVRIQECCGSSGNGW